MHADGTNKPEFVDPPSISTKNGIPETGIIPSTFFSNQWVLLWICANSRKSKNPGCKTHIRLPKSGADR